MLDDAPILTQHQIDALEHIDKEGDGGELWACVSHIHPNTLNNLEKRGFIQLRDEDGETWAMATEDGVTATVWHIVYGSQEHYLEKGYYERRNQKLREKKMAKKKLSAWELKARENLTDTQVDVLKLVKSHTGGCPADLVNHHTRKSLERYGYLEYDSENNVVILTADGYEKLAGLPARAGTVASMVRPYEEPELSELDNADSQVQEHPIPQPLPHSNEEGEQCADDCDECVYREVVVLISKKHPEVSELADAMVAQRRLLAKLKLGE